MSKAIEVMKILLTGFNRFAGLTFNPSEVIVNEFAARARHYPDMEIVTEVLRTEFTYAGKRIQELIRRDSPEGVLCLGVDPNQDAICLERIALNLNDTTAADNMGEVRLDRIIIPDGPVAYWSTLPLDRFSKVLKSIGIPVRFSNHAGTYVCNHVFYLACYEIEQLMLNAKCGFIHVPLPSEMPRVVGKQVHKLSIIDLFKAIEICVKLLNQDDRELT